MNSGSEAPIVLDVEASGFGRGSYPIEVGFAAPDGRSVCSLIRPAPHWTHWDQAAERVHGLSRNTVERHGRQPAEVAQLLNRELDGLIVYSDAWGQDYGWLNMLFDEAGTRPLFALRHLRELLSEDQADRWHVTRARVLQQMQLRRHRASSDARALQLTLLAVRRGDA